MARTERSGAMAAAAVMLAAAAALAGGWAAGLPYAATVSAGLVVFAVGFWATGALPEHLTALAFFLLAMLAQVAPAPTVFSGFHSTAFWLVFSGLIIGIAVRRTGLGERIAALLMARMGQSYLSVIAGIAGMGVILSFLMPSSMGRVVLMMPITLALADSLGFAEGSRGRAGMAICTGLISFVPGAAVLPAAVPNMVLIGAVETQLGMTLDYAWYLLLHFPVLGLLKTGLLVGLVTWMFHDQPQHAPTVNRPGPPDRDERRLGLILIVSLALWATDMFHGISPAWVGLAAALLCLMPGLALVPLPAFSDKVNYASLFYVAGILGMGALVSHSGLGQVAAKAVLPLLPLAPGAPVQNYLSLSGLAMLTGLVTTMPGVPAVLTPLAPVLAETTGLSLDTVVMTQVVGYSTLLLPYQVPPLVVAMQMGRVRGRDGARATLLLAALTLVLLVPLDYAWWRLLGVLE